MGSGAAVLGERDEVEGRHDAALGMPPAHQRLHARRSPRRPRRRRAGTRGRTDRSRARDPAPRRASGGRASSAFMLGWKNCQRSPPSSEARRMAASALLQQLHGGHAVAGVDGHAHAQGQQELVLADRQRLGYGGEDAAARLPSASDGPAAPGSRAAKAPPPRYATVSSARPTSLQAPAELLEQQVRVLGPEDWSRRRRSGRRGRRRPRRPGACAGRASAPGRALLQERRVGEAGHRVVEPPAGRHRVAAASRASRSCRPLVGLLDYCAHVRLGTGSLRLLAARGSCDGGLKPPADSGTLPRS